MHNAYQLSRVNYACKVRRSMGSGDTRPTIIYRMSQKVLDIWNIRKLLNVMLDEVECFSLLPFDQVNYQYEQDSFKTTEKIKCSLS